MIFIKNLKVFNCSINESFHWSKLLKLKEKMNEERIFFPCFADLSSADLRFANLRFADLSFADLRFANLRSADLSSADLRFADLRSADLSSADLRFADLSFADLRFADLSFADLRFANLSFADLRFADLSFADLSFARLQDIEDKEVIVNDFMSVCGLGSQNRNTLIFNTNIGVVIKCGCFYGTEKAFKKQVKETHGNNCFAKEYFEMLKLAKIRFDRGDND